MPNAMVMIQAYDQAERFTEAQNDATKAFKWQRFHHLKKLLQGYIFNGGEPT